ncbi:MAG: carboxymuconolactone decarboxylase family protein [Longimicrobiales bacterium]|nr:carboxymuconolactone decarboxylase family protein [Longimicrobiales bacterium]
MSRFESFKTDEVPDKSKSMRDKIESKYGFVPNLIDGIVRSPHLLDSYMKLSENFESSSLSPKEQQVVLLTASRLNECEYCTSVHSMTAEKAGIEWNTVEKIRNREKLSDERLEALRTFTERVVKDVGSVPHDVHTQFKNAGFTKQNALDVLVGVTLKTLTNTTNHLIETPLDEQFQKRAWSAESAQASESAKTSETDKTTATAKAAATA